MNKHIENFLLKHLLKAITVEDIVRNDPKTKDIVIEGERIKQDELRAIQAEIKALEGFRIWKIITATTKSNAEEKIFNQSVTTDDIRFGKAMLYNLSLQQSIINVLKNKTL